MKLSELGFLVDHRPGSKIGHVDALPCWHCHAGKPPRIRKRPTRTGSKCLQCQPDARSLS